MSKLGENRRNMLSLGRLFTAIVGVATVGSCAIAVLERRDRLSQQEAREDVGAKVADLNGSLERLELRLADLTKDVATIQRVTPAASPAKEQVSKRESAERVFAENSQYSVLVFHKPEQRETATRISRTLLSVGFRSSATPTSLKESIQQLNANQGLILYTRRGQQKLATLREVLSSTGSRVEYVYREGPSTLRSGDIQLLVF